MSDAARQGPIVSGTQVMSAGVASAGAALVTSKFGVTGTLLGAALTAMIITGGSAILKAYVETVTGRVRKVPGRFRERRKAGRYAEPSTLPGRPDLLNNFAGRMRAALDWFSHLPLLTRRSILIKGLIAAAVAFVISMGAVYAFEKVIGNSLSCGVWANCPEGAKPGIHLAGADGTGASSTIAGNRAKTPPSRSAPLPRSGSDQGGLLRGQEPVPQQNPGYQTPVRQQNPSDSTVEPVDPDAAPTPVEPEIPAEEPVGQGGGNQTPEQPAPGDEQGIPPQDDVPVGGQSAPAQ
jgi:hypothetical protein